MAPTTTQVRNLRGDISDTIGPLLLGYSEIAYQYALAEADYNLTVVYLLRRMIARLHTLYAACEGKDARIALEKRIKGAKEALEGWSLEAGIYGGAIQTGVISLDLDVTEDDLTFGAE